MNTLNMHITEVKKHMKRRNYDKDIEEINNGVDVIEVIDF